MHVLSDGLGCNESTKGKKHLKSWRFDGRLNVSETQRLKKRLMVKKSEDNFGFQSVEHFVGTILKILNCKSVDKPAKEVLTAKLDKIFLIVNLKLIEIFRFRCTFSVVARLKQLKRSTFYALEHHSITLYQQS